MTRAGHPNNERRCAAYIRESLPVCNFTNSYLNKFLTLEVNISNKMTTVLLYIEILVKHFMNLTLLSAI